MNEMRHFLTVVGLLLLTSCSDQPASPHRAEGPFWADEDGQRPASGNLPSPSWQPSLPGDVRFDVPAHLHADTVYSSRSGATRRRLIFELATDPGQMEAVVTAALAKADYRADPPKPGKDGWYSIRYRKKGAPNVTATFYPGPMKRSAHPDAKSMVSFSWQLSAAPKKTKG